MALTERDKQAIADKEKRLETPFAERVGIELNAGTPNVQGPVKDHVTRVPAKWTPGFKHTKEGWCIVESRRQMNNFAKERGLEWS